MTQSDLAKFAFLVAVIGSIAAGLLLLASSAGIWMEGAYLHPTPRINALTVGCGAIPIAVLAWIVFVWTRRCLSGASDVILRILISLMLVLGAIYALFIALFAAFFVG